MKKNKILSLVLVFFLALALIGCGEPKVSAELENAKNFLYSMYKDGAATTPDDYELVSTVMVEGVKYTVDWTVEIKSGNADDVKVVAEEGKKTVIDVNKYAEADVEYTLTATIKDAKGSSISQAFEKKLPAFSLTTWEEYMAAEKGTTVNVKGIVSAAWKESDSTALVYFQDEKGGYYAYRLAITPESFATLVSGVEILVTGSKDIYSTVSEIAAGCTFEITNATPNPVTPLDITELFKAAEKISDQTLVDTQGMLVTLKGVELLNIEDKYLWFQLGGKKAYLYISSSTCFANADQQAALKEKMVNGQKADLVGIVSLYNSEIQLLPLDDASITHVVEVLTDEEIVAKAEEKALALAVDTPYAANIELFTSTPQGATVTWVSGNKELLTDDGKIVAYPLEDTPVELTATITAGAATKEVKVTVKVAALAPSKASAINAACKENTGATYMLEGVYIAPDKSGYGFVADETGVVYVRYKFESNGINVGDTVQVIGMPTVYTSKQYTLQMGGSIQVTKIEKDIKVMEPVLIHGADLAKPATQEEAFANRYYGLLVKMTVTVGYKEVGGYTNPYITFDDGVEGMYWYSAGKLDDFKAFDGKTIEIVCPIYSYFTTGYDMWFLGTFVSAKEGTAAVEYPEGTITPTEAVAKADKEAVIVKGQVTKVVQGTGLLITDGAGSIFVYTSKASIEHILVGDNVVVQGTMGTYNKGRQIASPVITIVESGKYEVAPEEITLDALNALNSDDPSIYGKAYKITGTPVVSGNYVNLAEGNSLYLSDADKALLANFADQQVELVVYIYQYNSKAAKFNLFADASSAVAK